MIEELRPYGSSLAYVILSIMIALVAHLPSQASVQLPFENTHTFKRYLERSQPHLGAFFNRSESEIEVEGQSRDGKIEPILKPRVIGTF
ncbi:MAG: hypothetical protein EOP04_06665 [Proteobacteria bacterium]|nr:MAG: hypothetical protein EOP04_06665 [Pseudomonadota bacterium]